MVPAFAAPTVTVGVKTRKKSRHRTHTAVTVSLVLGALLCVMQYTPSLGLFRSGQDAALHGRELITCTTEVVEAESHYPHLDAIADSPVLQIFLMLYMFVGLAVVCDEYFESSLDAICKFLGLSDDVAGATFMAAGSSAPELFTSVMGVFVSESDVGVGTIVGSAVFNVLIIIGLCSFAAQGESLSWWPLTRDSIFYCCSVLMLVFVILIPEVTQVESILMLVMYAMYIVIMKFNPKLEQSVKRMAESGHQRHLPGDAAIARFSQSIFVNVFILLVIVANLVVLILEFANIASGTWVTDTNLAFSIIFILEAAMKLYGFGFFAYWRDPTNAFDGILVLLIFGEIFISAASQGAASSTTSNLRTLKLVRIFRGLRGLRCLRLVFGTKLVRQSAILSKNAVAPSLDEPQEQNSMEKDLEASPKEVVNKDKVEEAEKAEVEEEEDDDDDDGPSNPFEIPDGIVGKLYWAFTLPIVLLLFYTVPDCRREIFKKFFIATFSMSIVWIAGFSFIMVWMAELLGARIGIPPPVMGLTFLAAGTSIPDTIASVNVARAGKGDMAVSNSLGSNVFDILIGLGLPWVIKTCFMGAQVQIFSESLLTSIMILFITVALVVLMVHGAGWLLTKRMGYVLLCTYGAYVCFALLLEYGCISG